MSLDSEDKTTNKKDSKSLFEHSKLTQIIVDLELLKLKAEIAEKLLGLKSAFDKPLFNANYVLKDILGLNIENNEPINITATGTSTFTAPVAPINFTDSATATTTFSGSVAINSIQSASWKKELTFNALRQANLARIPLFKNAKGEQAHSESDGSDWSLAEWCNAVCGELGEAANIIKKIGRGDFTLEDAREDLAKEFADIVVYLDILAMRAGVNLGDAVVKKFNEVSERVGCNIFLSEQLINYYLNKPEEEVKEQPKPITKEQAEQCLIEEVLNVINICSAPRIIVSNEVSEILKKAKEFIPAAQDEINFHNKPYTDLIGSLNNCKIETPAQITSQITSNIPMHYIYKYGNNSSWILLHELSI